MSRVSKRRKIKAGSWSNILAIDMAIIGRYKTIESKKATIKRAFVELFCTYTEIHRNTCSVDYLFVKSLDREDYNILFNNIIDCCHASKHSIDIKGKRTRFYKLSALWPLFLITVDVALNPDVRKYCRLDRLYLVLRAARIYDAVLKVSKCNFKNLVVFCVMQPIDYALVEHSKEKSIPTITLQHGLYVDYSKQRNINEVNYLLHNADIFLAWGSNTQILIESFHKSANVHVCGKPISSPEKHVAKKIISVILDQNLFQRHNWAMLEIVYFYAEKYGYRVQPRLHPYNSEKTYEKFLDNTITISGTDILEVELAIGHTSSYLYELMALGVPVMRYSTNAPALATDYNLEFTDASSFEKNLHGVLNGDFNFTEEGKKYIAYTGSDSEKKYTQFFEKYLLGYSEDHSSV